jgi:TatD DNase family protein
LHPQLVAERASEISLWEEYLAEARYIGEVGLDGGPRFHRSLDLQKEIFQRVLQRCARAGGKFITVHSVRSAKPVLDMIEKHFPRGAGGVVLHWFTGSKAEARRAVDLGCYFSVNAEMLRKEQHRDLVRSMPVERILTETDGPFTRTADGPTRPSDIRAVIHAIAQCRDAGADAMATTVRTNLITFLGDQADSWAL